MEITYIGNAETVTFCGVEFAKDKAVAIEKDAMPRFTKLEGNPYFKITKPKAKAKKAKAKK